MIRKMYQRLLKTHFIAVQSCQTAILMGTGDILAQTVIEKKTTWKQYEPKRTAQFVFIGGTMVGPALTVWYRTLAKYVGHKTSTKTALKKMALDQACFAPSFLAVFITTVNLMQGKGLDHIKKEFSHKYIDVLLTNYKIWPAVQLVNFYFLPLQYQVLLVQCVAIFWNTYLSWKTQYKLK